MSNLLSSPVHLEIKTGFESIYEDLSNKNIMSSKYARLHSSRVFLLHQEVKNNGRGNGGCIEIEHFP